MIVNDYWEPIEDVEVGDVTFQLVSVNYINTETRILVKRQLFLYHNDKPVNQTIFHELSEHEFALAKANRNQLDLIITDLVHRTFS
jgi:hypothetical protein